MKPYIPKIGEYVRIVECTDSNNCHFGKIGKVLRIDGIRDITVTLSINELCFTYSVAPLSRRGVNGRTMKRNAKGQFVSSEIPTMVEHALQNILPPELKINGVTYIRK